MKKQYTKFYNFILIFALTFGGFGQVQAQGQNALPKQNALAAPAAIPATTTDETKVPHYFGPFPNYANSPQTVPDAIVAIDPPAAGTTATAIATVNPVDGSISGFTITNPGGGYTTTPLVSISGLGTGAFADAVLDPTGIVNSITPDLGGSGYTAPSVAITLGGATTDATATATGSVDPIIKFTGGSGFDQQPMVTFSLPNDPAGVQATGSATMTNGVVDTITVENAGSGYTSAPDVTITDGLGPIFGNGTGATATATLHITGFTMNTFGTGYTSAPTVTISDDLSLGGLGSGAQATPTMTYGSITGIIFRNDPNTGNPAIGSGYLTPGIKKFVDTLPGLGPNAANNLGNYISIAVPDTTTYPGTDYYEIAVVQYRQQMSSSLPGQGTLLRGYVQLETSVLRANPKANSAHVQLTNANLDPNIAPTVIDGYFGVDSPRYLGATIVAQRDRPVRILFRDLLPTGVAGDLFLPVDTTVMGSGTGSLASDQAMAPADLGTVMDAVRNPICNAGFNAAAPNECYTQNRATLHLHGGITPWISDGTPHQWITPAGENTAYPQGVSVTNVPDMPDPGPGAQTFFYTNQQSARLMFYHDHSWGITRLNVYAGEAAGYVLTDSTEAALMAGPLKSVDSSSAAGGLGIPLIIQDKTFVPSPTELARQDPTWNAALWGGEGNLWLPHVMMPAQNPGSSTGQSNFGRWMYGPWFWPPASPKYLPIANPYFTDKCDPNVILADGSNQFCEPPLIPGVPNLSVGMEAFNDTPIVNGVAYPTVTLDPKSYRFRILNAANDRFLNLQWYVADSATASTGLNAKGLPIGGTEVALNAAEVAAAQTNPDISPTPDTVASPVGPNWVQIGTEGGFLPTPTTVSGSQITTFITNPTRFDVGNVDKHSLLLGTAERGDVIVDFSKYAGKTLILYNDAPAAFPARVANYDYYTGGPDLTGSGGAPTTLPGYGPNTRTIMQVKIAANPPAAAFNMVPLNAAFAHHTDAAGKPAGVFESSQDPIIVGQAAYNTAYGTAFRSAAPNDGFARINDMSLTFNTLPPTGTTPLGTLNIPFKNKGMHDEMNSAVFDEFGRMSANLGLEAPGATPLTQNIILYPYINPTSEFVTGLELPFGANGSLKATRISSAADGTQIWKLTHNGVDTHPIHFHLFNVQIINRVTWDNIIIKPEASELGWKDTIRVSPLEDTIIALRPIVPKSPFGLPDSVRPLNPAMKIGDASGFNNTDFNGNPLTGTNTITNQMTNFGWEYVWHCHILGHEEMDMMRPIKVDVSRALAAAPVLVFTHGAGGVVNLTWTDGTPINYLSLNPASWGDPSAEIGYRVERSEADLNTSPATWTGKALANQISFPDSPPDPTTDYYYRVTAYNAAGDSVSNVIFVPGLPKAPTNLTAVVQPNSSLTAGAQVLLNWTNNATTVTNVVVERATGAKPFDVVATLSPIDTSYLDTTVVPGPYSYRIYAVNAVGQSVYAGPVTVTVAQPGSTTVVLNSPNPSFVGNMVTFSAIVNSVLATGTPSGTVTFTANGVSTSVALTAGMASFSTATLPAGKYTVTAAYSGDTIFLPSTGSVTQTVNQVVTTTTLTSSLNPSVFGDNVTFTASVSPAAATGTVTFTIDGVAGTPQTLTSGKATYSTTALSTALSAGAHPVTAAYSGDPTYASSTSVLITQNVSQAATTTTLTSSLNPSNFGQNVTFTASVSPAAAAGTVTFNIDGVDGIPQALSVSGQATYPTAVLAIGTHSVSATYNGAANYSSSTSSTLTQTVNGVPAAPSSLVATAVSSTQINLAWTDNASNETGFTIQRATNAAFTTGLATITLNAANQTAYINTGRNPSTTYYYRVLAFNGVGSSASSNIASAFTAVPGSPAAPSNLAAAAFSPSQINLTWTDNALNETGFTIQRSTSINFTGTTTITLNVANQSSYSNTGRQPNTTYYYRVRAFNAAGPSAWSNAASATTPSAIPTVPAGLTVTAPAANSLLVSWIYTSNGTPGPITFQVQRSNTGAGRWTTVANNLTPSSFTNNGLPVNTLRYYHVRAVSPTGNSAWSTIVSGRTLP